MLRQSLPRIIAGRLWLSALCLFGVFTGLLPDAVKDVGAAGTADSRAADIDSRWLPWMGSWRLVSDTAVDSEAGPKESCLLEISPGENRDSVNMQASRDGQVLFKDSIATNGLAQPLKEKECSGWYQYSWSETGKRLLFESKSSCPGELSQKISGLSIINKNGEWLDIQLLQRQDDRIITLRRYSPVPHKAADSDEYSIGRVRTSRNSAGTGFSIDEVVEISRKVAPEVLEAALVEYHEPFLINSKTLVYLLDAGVPSQVTDLMVALSFPEKFTVEPRTVSIAPRTGSERSDEDIRYVYPPYGYYYIVDPLFPWYWTPYTYSLYWSGGWGIWSGYPYWGSPVYAGRVYRNTSSGRLVAGHGYTRIDQSRYARPKSGGAASAPASVIRNSGSSPNSRIYSTGGSSGSVSSVPATETRRIASPPPSSGSPRIVSPPASSGRVISAPSGGGVRVSTPSGGGATSAPPAGTSSGSSGRKARER